MQLKQCISNIEIKTIIGDLNKDISSIQIDSRNVKAKSLFVAMKGTQTDGHQYIDKAISLGASTILCEDIPTQVNPDTTYIQVEHCDKSLGDVASTFYGNPSSKLKLVGVTGTNGKTTIATLLYQMFKALGYKVGLLSTVCNYIDNEALHTTHTTPDAVTINQLLAEMVEVGCDFAFMEVSSHAVDQHRIQGLEFTGGIFTNLTRDHLDYHKTVENYIKAKKAFFDNLPNTAFALINNDDKVGSVMVQNTKALVKTYSLRGLSDFKAKIVEMLFNGMILEVDKKEIAIQFTGRFNAYNLLAVYGASILLNQDIDEVMVALSTLNSVSGRFETLHSPQGYTVIVDYAHTPDALNNVLSTIHDILDGKGKIITVCGAGGNRDKGKRPLMTHEAAMNSDRVILTSDNPRFEDPQAIVDDMLEGISKEDKQKVITILDRREAIKTACVLAQPTDVILIAGKGHETYQAIQGVNHHFDDKEEVNEIFKTQQ